MIKYHNQTFDIVKEFDCRVLSFSYKEGGSFFTAIPISSKEYRDEQLKRGRKLPCKVDVCRGKRTTEFKIIDDWGSIHTVILSNGHKVDIEKAITQAKTKHGLEITET